MRRLLLVLAVLGVLGAAAAVFVLGRGPSGPFPAEAELRVRGFAVWPVDTVAEATEECADAEGWRLDEDATAVRFVRDVLRYPKPYVSDDFGDGERTARRLMNTRDSPGVTLGSVVEMALYGRCWYVTGVIPREGDVGATLGFVYREGRPHLLLAHPDGIPPGFVGYGDWETEIGHDRQTVLPIPELEPGATGHAIYTQPDESGFSEMAGARPLAPVPPPPSGPPAKTISLSDVVDNPKVCRLESSPFKSPERVIKYLYEWTFDNLLRQVDGYPRYERKGFRHLGGDRWRLVVDDAVLIARIPEIADRCYKLVSLEPVGRDIPLRRLWIEDEAVTFGVDWGGGDEASLAFGTGYDGLGATLGELQEPVTFPRQAEPQPSDVPTYARVILYKDGHVVSAYYGLFES